MSTQRRHRPRRRIGEVTAGRPVRHVLRELEHLHEALAGDVAVDGADSSREHGTVTGGGDDPFERRIASVPARRTRSARWPPATCGRGGRARASRAGPGCGRA